MKKRDFSDLKGQVNMPAQPKKKPRINPNENEIEIGVKLLAGLQTSLESSSESTDTSSRKETSTPFDNNKLEPPYSPFENTKKKLQLSEEIKKSFLKLSDYEYLKDKKIFLRKISTWLNRQCPSIVLTKLTELVNHLEEGSEKIHDEERSKEVSRFLADGKWETFFTDEEQEENELNKLQYDHIREIRAGFWSVLMRHIILTGGMYELEQMSCLNDDLSIAKEDKIYLAAPNTYFVKGMTEPQSLPDNIDLIDFEQKLQDVTFKQKILAVISDVVHASGKKKFLTDLEQKYGSFLTREYRSVQEISCLYHFERTILLFSKYSGPNKSKGLFLMVGNILEGSSDYTHYNTGGHQSSTTSDRSQLIEYLFGLQKRKKQTIKLDKQKILVCSSIDKLPNESLMSDVPGATAPMNSSSSSKTHALSNVDFIPWEKHKNLLLIYWAYQKSVESVELDVFETLAEQLETYSLSDRELLDHEIYASKEAYLKACHDNLSKLKKEIQRLPLVAASGMFVQTAKELKMKIQNIHKIIEEVSQASDEPEIIANLRLTESSTTAVI